jgi:hypothetical protein
MEGMKMNKNPEYIELFDLLITRILKWFFRKRYFIEFEATDYDGINWSQVKVIKANSEAEARQKFDAWAETEDFKRYSVMDVREVR